MAPTTEMPPQPPVDRAPHTRKPAISPPSNALLRTSRSHSTRPLTATENALCGATAGLASRSLVAPFDVVKITLQLETQRRSYTPRPTRSSVLACATRIYSREGIWGLFKGNLSASYLYLSYGATQFFVFGSVDRVLAKISAIPKEIRSFVGGASAGAIATSVTYPFDLLRTRFVAQESSHKVHQSILGAISQITREEGMQGFYRGLWPACLQIMPYMGIVFASYDALGSGYKWIRNTVVQSDNPLLRTLDSMQDAIIGGSAAVIGKCCVYPLDLVRKRLQIQGPHLKSYAGGNVPRYTGMSQALMTIARNEGFFALFRGLTPALVKAAPTSAVIFYVYGLTRDLVLSVR
ncbi:mitochondrial thiamine pyrophosphate transporter [Coemansia sp. Benny D115]|nr:mitochondrial thiamine pyrophosphate transporter [Coemansia sp. Benny D115]